MKLENVLKKLGVFGKWQLLLFGINIIGIKTFTNWKTHLVIYTGYRPPHHCKIPENSSLHQWIPVIDNETFSSCSMYDIESSINSSVLIPSNRTTNCNNGWTFDLEESGPTVVSKWDLVCDKAYLMQTSQTLLLIGQATSLFSTKISDKFGRKPTLLASTFLMGLAGLVSAFVNRIEAYLTMRFFVGFFLGGSVTTQLVYLGESFSSEGRVFYGVISSAYWGLAATLLPFFAFLITNWIYLEIFTSICCFIFIPFLIWWLPETIPWLYANDRLQKAEAVTKRVAKCNKINLTEQDLNIFSSKRKVENCGFATISAVNADDSRAREERFNSINAKLSITLLIRHRYLRRHMCLAFMLVLINFCYYGVTYMSGSLSANHYLSGALNSFVEIPACIIAYLICRRYGRKVLIISFNFLAAVPIFLCILTTTYEKEIPALVHVTLTLNVLFKLFASASNSVIFFIGAELFPTNIKTQAIGICLMIGRLGGMAATYSSLIIELYPKPLYACFGVLSVLGGVLTFILPETKNKPIPTTIEDIEAWYEKPPSKSSKDGLLISEITIL